MPLLREQLANIPDVTAQFNSVRATAGRQHLFTDGACMLQDVKGLALAGWGVISASTGDVVSCGPLHGMWQTAPRAELCAVISAVRWAIATRVAVNLWTDCKHVVLGVQKLLDSPWDPLPIDNQDLWSQLAQLLQQLESGFLQIVHIPSHLDPARCESPFEEWVARHNAHADTVAGIANSNRSYAFQQLYMQVINEQLELKSIIRALRGIFFRIAAQTLQGKGQAVVENQHEAEEIQQVPLPVGVPRSETTAEAFPLDWRRRCEAIQIDLPVQFIVAVTEFFMEQDGDAAIAFEVSWIEFAFLVTVADVLEFPAFHPTAGVWVNARDMPLRPPLSNCGLTGKDLLDMARSALLALCTGLLVE
ncbi:Ribonuclease H [Symbiodinium microadriaticum]|uniref:Ribonuclease H n=1 Tax=Symbiodinium microadriaticum TaxID=2951 RepID=A0A1Q9C5G8_SYMMI|nr:Ribonuclease H [Symbiodinium microadriaticum]